MFQADLLPTVFNFSWADSVFSATAFIAPAFGFKMALRSKLSTGSTSSAILTFMKKSTTGEVSLPS